MLNITVNESQKRAYHAMMKATERVKLCMFQKF